MAVIADTSPLNYLVLIEAQVALRRLYQWVLIPDPVWQELQHPDAPKIVAEWATRLPSWIQVVPSKSFPVEPELADLDPGARAAIALAKAHLPNVLLLMDDWDAGKQKTAGSQPSGRWVSCGTPRLKDSWIFRRLWPACAKPASAPQSIC